MVPVARQPFKTSITAVAIFMSLVSWSALLHAFPPDEPISAAQGDFHSALPAQATAPIPGDWQRITPYTDTFSIALPPGWTFRPMQGVDSLIGAFEGGGIRLEFDYGLYSNSLAEPGDAGYLLTDERIDCKQARIVEPIGEPARTTGVFFAEVDRQGAVPFEFVTSLEVHGVDLSVAERALVLQILRTIRFEKRCLGTGLGDWEIFEAPRSQADSGWNVPFLMAVDAPSRNEVRAVGAAWNTEDPDFIGCSALRFDGERWQPMECDANFPLMALDVASPNVGWAGGMVELLTLDGSGWRQPDPPQGPFGFIHDLKMIDAERGRAVGDGFNLNYEGGRWSSELSMGGQALALTGPDDGWAVDEDALYRLSGGQWSEPVTDASMRLGGFGISLEDEAVWIAGHNADSGLGEIIGYDLARGAFEAVEFAGSSHVYALDLFSNGTGVAVGGNDEDGPAIVFERRGGVWTPFELPFPGVILDLEMASANEGWAVGYRTDDDTGDAYGVMLRYAGRAGAQQETPEPTISPTPNNAVTWTPTPASPPDTAEPGPARTVYLPRLFRSAPPR